jgi:hypothetical protein
MFAAAMSDPKNTKRRRGENGAIELTVEGVEDPRVALFVGLVRGASHERVRELVAGVVAAFERTGDAQFLVDLVLCAMQTRHCRGGKGEKQLFYWVFLELYRLYPKLALSLVDLIPHFGYWKDLFLLLEACISDEEGPRKVARTMKGKREYYAPLWDRVVDVVIAQLRYDMGEFSVAEAAQVPPRDLSLLAKWIPKEGRHFDRVLQIIDPLAKQLFPESPPPTDPLVAENAAACPPPSSAPVPAALERGDEAARNRRRKKYRQTVSALNRALGTPEVLMAARRYEEINFAKVASRCMMKNRKAFLNELIKTVPSVEEENTGNRYPNDDDRVAARLRLREVLVTKGVKGTQLFPHEIVQKFVAARYEAVSTAEKDVLEKQWESMRDGVVAQIAAAKATAAAKAVTTNTTAAPPPVASGAVDAGNVVALVDVSGSMTGTPMDVAIALGILVSEIAAPAFRDRFLTFHSDPRWVSLADCATLGAKVAKVRSAPWGMNTNFDRAINHILTACKTHMMRPEHIPDLLVLSDMQFDSASSGGAWATTHERLVAKFAAAGIKVCGAPWPCPRITYWNLRGGAVGFPVSATTPGVRMISGFSPALLKLLLSGQALGGSDPQAAAADARKAAIAAGLSEAEQNAAASEAAAAAAAEATPMSTMRAALDDDLYDPVRTRIMELGQDEVEEPFASWPDRREEGIPTASPIPIPRNIVHELTELHALFEEGALTAVEFDLAKTAVLSART